MFPKTWGDGAVGYIDRVVRANNTFIDLLDQARWQPPEMRPAKVGSALAPFAAGSIVGYLSVSLLRRWLSQHV